MKEYDLKETCNMLGLSPVYVRRMILQGKLKSRKVEIATNTYKHLISEDEIKRWRGTIKGTGIRRREDGRNKFNIYCSPDEFDKLQKLLKEQKLETPFVRANVVKKNK